MDFSVIIFLVVGILIGAAVGFFIGKSKTMEMKGRNDLLGASVVELKEKLTKVEADNMRLTADNEAIKVEKKVLDEQLSAIQKQFKDEFENLAKKILEENSEKFTKANKLNIEGILNPLKENIDIFKKKVDETYDKESKERFSLSERVKELIKQTDKVSEEANNLASALKGEAKTRGNWGEMILESILQKSGLEKDREYFVQPTIKDDEGNNQRPDVIVQLPDHRMIIIDSKVSLVAYDALMSAETLDIQQRKMKEHIASVKNHIDGLSGKNYDNISDALDFTMMFIPIEPAYLVAVKEDADLWSYAYAKRILLVSPTNLIACLKLMADLWKREKQSKNAMEIVKRGELLYEKFVNFVETMQNVGINLGRTQDAYTKALGQLKEGRGNLINQANELKNLGLKSSKQLPFEE
jgi:DNA recombination protein RmuC